MKLLKAIIRPNKVDDVKDALARLNVSGLTVTEVRGHGKQKGHTAVYRGKEYNVSLLPKMQIEAVVSDAIAEDAIRAIVEAARTGEIGDGRVFVQQLLQLGQLAVGVGAGHRRHQVVDDGGVAAALGLGALAGVVDDERVDQRQLAEDRVRRTGR